LLRRGWFCDALSLPPISIQPEKRRDTSPAKAETGSPKKAETGQS
jgi:hypothetical protein